MSHNDSSLTSGYLLNSSNVTFDHYDSWCRTYETFLKPLMILRNELMRLSLFSNCFDYIRWKVLTAGDDSKECLTSSSYQQNRPKIKAYFIDSKVVYKTSKILNVTFVPIVIPLEQQNCRHLIPLQENKGLELSLMSNLIYSRKNEQQHLNSD